MLGTMKRRFHLLVLEDDDGNNEMVYNGDGEEGRSPEMLCCHICVGGRSDTGNLVVREEGFYSVSSLWLRR